MTDKIPLVSVIIPMYNSAKFIPQTLESLCYQTMKDFEVIVVDDGSTDNSVEVVESFSERFNGRLHVIKLPKNTGTPGLPRNVGIQFARGKYIAFLDSDDLYTKTALEELTALAEQYQADVVHTDSWFWLWGGNPKSDDDPAMTDFNELTNSSNLMLSRLPMNTPVYQPFLVENNLIERVKDWVNRRYRWATCSSACKRDFLITNRVFFSDAPAHEDNFFNFSLLILSKKYLRVPNAVYIVRPHTGSIIRENEKLNIEKYYFKWLRTLNDSFNVFEKFMTEQNIFKEHPDYRYAVLEFLFQRILDDAKHLPVAYTQNPLFALYELVKKEFHSDDAAFAAYLFNTVNIYRLQLTKMQAENIALKKKLQKHSLQLIELQQDNITLKKELQKYRSAQ